MAGRTKPRTAIAVKAAETATAAAGKAQGMVKAAQAAGMKATASMSILRMVLVIGSGDEGGDDDGICHADKARDDFVKTVARWLAQMAECGAKQAISASNQAKHIAMRSERAALHARAVQLRSLSTDPLEHEQTAAAVRKAVEAARIAMKAAAAAASAAAEANEAAGEARAATANAAISPARNFIGLKPALDKSALVKRKVRAVSRSF